MCVCGGVPSRPRTFSAVSLCPCKWPSSWRRPQVGPPRWELRRRTASSCMHTDLADTRAMPKFARARASLGIYYAALADAEPQRAARPQRAQQQVWFKFNEGFSNAVRKPLLVKDFL